MANNNLQEIKLGTPPSIVGGAAPNAELTVQSMSQCHELTLHDESSRCTKAGAIKSAASLLADPDAGDMHIDLQGKAHLTSEEIDVFFNMLPHFSEDSIIVSDSTTDAAYQDAIDALHARFPQFNIEALKYFVRFKDPEVLRVLLANGVGDGASITIEDAEKVKSLPDFGNEKASLANTTIEHFDELHLFKNAAIPLFRYCSNLKSVDISGMKYKYYVNIFSNTGLEELKLDRVTIEKKSIVGFIRDCPSLKRFDASRCASFEPTIINGMFYSDTALEYVDISTMDTTYCNQRSSPFGNCTSVRNLKLSSAFFNFSTVETNPYTNIDILSPLTSWIDEEEISAMVGFLPDLNGFSDGRSGTLKLSANTYAVLTQQQIASASAKRWTITK